MPFSLEFYKKVDNGDLGSFTVINGIAEDKRNFLAGEISGSFEKVLLNEKNIINEDQQIS